MLSSLSLFRQTTLLQMVLTVNCMQQCVKNLEMLWRRSEWNLDKSVIYCWCSLSYIFKFGSFFVMFAATNQCSLQLLQAMAKTKTSFSASGDCLQPTNSDVLQAVSSIRRNSTKLEQVISNYLSHGNFTPLCSCKWDMQPAESLSFIIILD